MVSLLVVSDRPTCWLWWAHPMHSPTGPLGVPQACTEPAEVFWTFLSMHATLFVDPGRPSQHSPIRALCVGFWAVKTIAICSAMLCIATLITGLCQDFRECGLLGACPEPAEGACMVPCVRFRRFVRCVHRLHNCNHAVWV